MTSQSSTPENSERPNSDQSYAMSWQAVLIEERAALAASTDVAQRGHSAGLAFSGGGIRSATFCLGVIQGLAAARQLSRFDYLSTVSGGGYIGSWLSALIKRRAGGDVAAVEPIIAPVAAHERALKAAERVDVSHEDPAIQWLRRYSNYLTPRVGLVGVDTWTAIATYIRNLTLNWLVLLPLLVSGILALAVVPLLGRKLQLTVGAAPILGAALVGLCVIAFCIGRGLDLPRDNVKASTLREPSSVFIYCGIGTLLTAWLAALGFGSIPASWLADDSRSWLLWIAVAAVANTFIWLFAGVVRYRGRTKGEPPTLRTPDFDVGGGLTEKLGVWLLWCLLSGAAAGALLRGWAQTRLDWQQDQKWSTLAAAAIDTVVGTPVLMFILAQAVLLFIGFAKRRMSESDREWLGRLGAIMFLLGMAWLLAFAMLWLGAVLVPASQELGHWLVGIGAGAWLLQTFGAVFLAKSSVSGGSNTTSKPRLGALLGVAPYIFVAGLVATISWASFHVLAQHYRPAGDAPTAQVSASAIADSEISLQHSRDKGTTLIVGPESKAVAFKETLTHYTGRTLDVLAYVNGRWLLLFALVSIAVAAFMSWRVDINLFSYNRFYGNRLGRAYLGASRDRNLGDPRQAHPFTDFDPDDDLIMAKLASFSTQGVPQKVQRPLHIINTALNLTGSPDLAWQSRKAASFTFTPLHCGFALPTAPSRSGVQMLPAIEGFRRTYAFGVVTAPSTKGKESDAVVNVDQGVTFGMAFPTSGAAASPNMGYHSKPSLSLLLTLFNVRLGRWYGNPRDSGGAWRKRTPALSLRALLNELLGKTGFTQPWLYLSDGGHFENLGIYELVRRKLKVIVAVDAAADPLYRFTDLANAIRLVGTDFGVRIVMPEAIEKLRPDAKSVADRAAVVFGEIHYPGDPDRGILIYVKPVLLADTPVDVVEYARRDTGFPQETTGDQWFSEAQFESYRRLGETITHQLCNDARLVTALRAPLPS